MSFFECEMWQFHKSFGNPNVQPEIFGVWEGPQKGSRTHVIIKEATNNKQQGFNRVFAQHMSARSLNNQHSYNRDFARLSAWSLIKIFTTGAVLKSVSRSASTLASRSKL